MAINPNLQLRILVIAMFIGLGSPIAKAQEPCASFADSIKRTYNFRPSALKTDAERNEKSADMDKVWATVKADKSRLVPCLRQALEDPGTDPWFRFDGSNLLVSVDPSEANKRAQIRNYALVNLEDVDLQIWVSTLAVRGFEGFDTSAAAERWLLYPEASYSLPLHGGFQVDRPTGALFLFGSMDENVATPALIRIVNSPNHPGRDIAMTLLADQATAESLQALRQVDISRFPSQGRTFIEKELNHPDLFEPRAKPKNSRPEFLSAFESLLNGKPDSFLELVSRVPDGEKDVVAVLTAADLPLVRRVRRRMIAGGNQHMIDYYESFTKIIKTIMFRAKAKAAS
jgi:hypothetical protein